MRNSGYHSCPCRDCFEIAIGTIDADDDQPALCHHCDDAGCDPSGESECACDPGCYDDDDDDDTE